MIITDIQDYIDRHEREYNTKDFSYSSYNAPHTMYYVSNDLDEILLEQSVHAIKLWHVILSTLKRNVDGTKACTIVMTYESCREHLSRNYFYKAIKELVDSALLFRTPCKHTYVVNIVYANKLFRPKLDM